MVSPGGRKRLRSSLDSPSQPVNLEWVPEGMDLSSACRVALHIPNYVEISNGGRHISHGNRDFQLVVDRDTTNLKDLSADISALVKHGINQGMNLTFWDNEICTHSALTSDSILMDAFDMYWELRRLPLIVTIYDTMPIDNSHQQTSQSTEPVLQICGVEPSNIVADSGSVEPSGISIDKPKKAKKAKVGKSIRDDDERWIDDEVEYVGLNDEEAYISDVEVNAEANYDPSDADSESGKDDELLVNDDDGCDVLEHVTNLE
ncbi:unnamed protein product [Urochloa decumbens]|uniref:Uncharacterized protein n=1 Tax=Urochloa decumbens TaxID=240449 RepID=A0ABC9AVG6_9POAL